MCQVLSTSIILLIFPLLASAFSFPRTLESFQETLPLLITFSAWWRFHGKCTVSRSFRELTNHSLPHFALLVASCPPRASGLLKTCHLISYPSYADSWPNHPSSHEGSAFLKFPACISAWPNPVLILKVLREISRHEQWGHSTLTSDQRDDWRLKKTLFSPYKQRPKALFSWLPWLFIPFALLTKQIRGHFSQACASGTQMWFNQTGWQSLQAFQVNVDWIC